MKRIRSLLILILAVRLTVGCMSYAAALDAAPSS